MVRAPLVVVAVTLAGLGSGCDSNSARDAAPTATAAAGSPAPRIVVVHDDHSLPQRCGVARTASRVVAFLDAFNRGDRDRLDALIADHRSFQWFSTTETGTRTERTYTATGATSSLSESPQDQRPALLRRLASRHGHAERALLVDVAVTRIPPGSWFPNVGEEVSGVDYRVRRDADDFGALGGGNRIASGKGALTCAGGRLLAWSVALDAGRRPGKSQRLCRATRRRPAAPRGAVIACTAGGARGR
jgi:hypothetical protein